MGKPKSVWGKKWLGGYSGLKFTAEQIAKYIPECEVYVEPFAGLARTAEYAKCKKMILNDMSEHSNQFCKENFPDATITHEDFRDCIKKWDSENTFFLIDPPWRDNVYSENDLTYSNMKISNYYVNIFYLLNKCQANWIVCTSQHSTGYQICENQRRFMKTLESDGNPIFGKKTHVVLISNLSFEND